MESLELAKAFNPADFEDRVYKFWQDHNAFAPEGSTGGGGKPPFVIVIPPPNVTGVLHMGHGLNNSLHDVLIRYQRMNGRPTLWIPGTDHAGIATQNVVDRSLRARGLDKHALGRERFVEETWKVKEEHHAIITSQLKKTGASCDWNRERFTLDKGCSRAVREVFVELYNRNLIYRGSYLVNWCSSCRTALADDEVEHRELPGKMYHYAYPLREGGDRLVIATTRPETMLGDTALAVNPEDERYKKYIGEDVRLPLTDRTIKVVADPHVDMTFGTGVVKITPAHDPNDWEISNRHDLERINILNGDGTLNDRVPKRYRGLSVMDARKAVVADLKAQGFFLKEEDHNHQVGHCYRCHTVIEPYLSKQWFVSMSSMAKKALAAWERGEIVFHPQKWENTYRHWLKGIRDWCISRQLWWGHRIPAWYCGDCGEMMVLKEPPSSCSQCGSPKIRQDEDVLDTWFSSWLWPFSTLGWPGKTEDLATYFPTSILITAYDIIFFWVARMIMASLEFLGQVPFKDVYITGLVRDKRGRKLSKSLGNGMDPLEIVAEYGADALKFTLVFMAAQGQDILIDKESFKLGSKFANKVWNASRYILMNLEGRQPLPLESMELKEVDGWIFHRLNNAIIRTREAMDAYRFNDAAQGVYEFFWNDFCDWYIEVSKLSLYSGDEAEKVRAVSLLAHILEYSLKLMHPMLSFISEEIYQKLPGPRGPLIVADYPEARDGWNNSEAAAHFGALQDLVRGVRTLRSEFTIPPEKRIAVKVSTDAGFGSHDFFEAHLGILSDFMGCESLAILREKPDASGSIPVAGLGFEAYVYIREAVDLPREVAKLNKEAANLEKLTASTEKKLSNEAFLGRAPAEVVAKERGKLEEFRGRAEKVRRYLAELSG